jgi:LPXTG-motif cell wall-anchored protein
MKRFVFAALVFVALLIPATAAAKEPTEAKISGPGFSKTLRVKNLDQWENSAIGHLTFRSGFFPAAVGQQPDPMLPGKPSGKLGPRYTVVWLVPAGASTHHVRQDFYPYARGGAVTYLKPGQPIFEQTTRGGWYRAYGLKQTLVSVGLPARAPKASSGSSNASLALLGIPGVLILTGAVLIYRRRNG